MVGGVSHDTHDHDSKALKSALDAAYHRHRQTVIDLAVTDRGCGCQQYKTTALCSLCVFALFIGQNNLMQWS